MQNNINLEQIKADIEKAEKKQDTKKSKQQVVNELKPHIELLKEKGYSISEIVKFLTDRGLAITEGTLKSYLNRNNTKITTKSKVSKINKKPKMIQQDIINDAEKHNSSNNIINTNENNINSKFPLRDDEV